MSPNVDIISRLRELNGSFPAREQQVADFVLGNLELVVRTNLTEIAKASGVSVATVNRFCQSLGCRGFKEFKIKFAQNVAVSLQYLHRSGNGPSSTDRLIDQVFGTLVETIGIARQQLDPERLNRAIEILAKAQRIAFLGVGGGSTTAASEAAIRFFRLGIPSESQSDGYLQRMLVSTFGPGDVVFAISASGLPQELVDSVGIAAQYRAESIALTRPDSPLANACDLCIPINLPENPDIYKPTASRLVFIAVLDILASGVARTRPEKTRETLRRIRSSLVAVSKDTRPNPIGD